MKKAFVYLTKRLPLQFLGTAWRDGSMPVVIPAGRSAQPRISDPVWKRKSTDSCQCADNRVEYETSQDRTLLLRTGKRESKHNNVEYSYSGSIQ